jgi:hypothetical protein
MGGVCSQKAHAPEGTAILSGALSASGSVRNQNSIAVQSCTMEPGGANIETVGKAEAGNGGDQPAEE